MPDCFSCRVPMTRFLLLGGALALPLALSVSPAAAQDAAADGPKVIKQHRIVIIDKDGAVQDAEADLKTRVIEKDGKTIVIKTNKALSEAEIEAKVAKALAAIPDAPPVPGKGERRVVIKRIHGEGAPQTMTFDHQEQAEGRVACGEGATATTFTADDAATDGMKRKAIMRFCLAEAGAKAADGLKAARDRISKDANLSPAIRDDILKQLDAEIERLSKQG